MDAQTTYLCGHSYPAAYNAYHDLNCAKCHREAWEAHTAPSKRAQAYLRRDLAARRHARENGYAYVEGSRKL